MSLDSNVLLTIGGDFVFVPLWLLLSVSAVAMVTLVIIGFVAKKNSDRKKDKALMVKIEEQEKADAKIRKILDDAPPITAFTEAEFPAGIDPYEYAHGGDGTLMDESRREEAYRVWVEEQKALRDKQIETRHEYFSNVSFDTAESDSGESTGDTLGQDKGMSLKERKQYEKIQRDNNKRIARAKRLKAKEGMKKNGAVGKN